MYNFLRILVAPPFQLIEKWDRPGLDTLRSILWIHKSVFNLIDENYQMD